VDGQSFVGLALEEDSGPGQNTGILDLFNPKTAHSNFHVTALNEREPGNLVTDGEAKTGFGGPTSEIRPPMSPHLILDCNGREIGDSMTVLLGVRKEWKN
jgi:hypothetical protein